MHSLDVRRNDHSIGHYLRFSVLILLVSVGGSARAAIVDVIKVGTWNLPPGSGNPTGVGGPGMATGVTISSWRSATTTLSQTTSLAHLSNDLGAGRSDGETFLDSTWTESGSSLVGVTPANDVDIAVALADAGLTNTTSTTTWEIEITGFEQVVFSVLVDGIPTSVFDDLITTGLLSQTNAELFAAFGRGAHDLDVMVSDLAGAQFVASAEFVVVPEPSTLLLMSGALGLLASTRLGRRPWIVETKLYY